MQDYEKLGLFYLGKKVDPKKDAVKNDDLILYDSKDLTTHAVCVGMTGSGKTGLGIALLEEAGIDGIPALIIDPKGDLGDLMLTFPQMDEASFAPWVDPNEAARQNLSPSDYAKKVAKTWIEGLKTWGEGVDRIQKLRSMVDIAIYTPASESGIPLAILSSFYAPPNEILEDAELLRDRIASTASSLLGLLDIDADPVNSREHILLSTLLEKSWKNHEDLDLAELIRLIQNPPLEKIGVFDLDSYYPAKERTAFALKLNHLLASPGFKAWMEGEPLDIQSLLYTEQGKPRLAVISIAHLSDKERMFFVTLLLNEIISWMRLQSGTSSLRALLYMDEIFGYFPPTAMPSSKMPMLTLLKQARAYGLGIMLATQNPVDLDYKGLANCGTWFIGKLQTERDRARLMEGLKMTSAGDNKEKDIDAMLSAVGSRKFILRSIHLPEPILFQTRWTLSYLSGPLTSRQIQTLMAPYKKNEVRAPVREKAETIESRKPIIAAEIPEYFYPSRGNAEVNYHAHLLGFAKLHYVDKKKNIDCWLEKTLCVPISDSGDSVWDQAEDISSERMELTKTPPEKGSYDSLSSKLSKETYFAAAKKSLASYLYQNQPLHVWEAADVKLSSKPDESQGDFVARVALARRERRDAAIAKIRQSYEAKIAAATEKVRNAQRRLEDQQSQVSRQKFDTYISVGTTILGALFGRKSVTKTTVSQAGTSLRRAERIGKEQTEAANAEQTLAICQQQLQSLQSEVESAVTRLTTELEATANQLETTTIPPRKSDISVEAVGILWR